jgi:hypothetical protein
MKKIVLALALAAGVALAAPSTPARADGGATAAIIGAAVIGGAMINHAACGSVVCWWWAPRPVPVYVAPAPWPFWPWWQPAVTVKPAKGKKKK